MDFNKLIQMLFGRFGRRYLFKGITMGMNHLSPKAKPAAEMTEAERQQAAAGKEMARKLKQQNKLRRRM